MSYVTVLADAKRKARTHHQCFHCFRSIAPGTTYGFQTNLYDGHINTIKWHLDCEAMASELRDVADDPYDEGWGPLREYLLDSGEYRAECDGWRGLYPHVITRMELTDQLHEDDQP